MKLRFILILLPALLSGCSLIYSYSDNLPQKINEWISNKDYKTALETISYIRPGHKYYALMQRKKLIIKTQIEKYESRVISRTEKLVEKGEWLAALRLLDEAEQHTGPSVTIQKQRNKILQQRNRLLQDYEQDLLTSQANYIIEKMPLYREIRKTVTDKESDEIDISGFIDLKNDTAQKLVRHSRSLIQRNRYEQALKNIELAQKLSPPVESRQEIRQLKKLIRKNTRIKKQKHYSQAKDLLVKLKQDRSYSSLKEAYKNINWLKQNSDGDNKFLQLAEQLQQHLDKGMKRFFFTARKLYSKGKTQEALSIWLELKNIDPDYPELQAHIQRAEKVLNKLKELSNKPRNK